MYTSQNNYKDNNMRCYICDVAIEKPNYNADHEDYEPCDYCQQIINETVGTFTDKAYADEDAFGEDALGVSAEDWGGVDYD